jgi:hypothetical protein
MEHQKLFSLLASLTDSEQKGVLAFLTKVNAPTPLEGLVNGLAAHHPQYSLSPEAWATVYDQIWPGEAYRPDRLRNRLSQLYQHLQHYLAELALLHQPELRERLYLTELQRRSLPRNFEIELKAARRRSGDPERITSEYFFHQYQLAELANSYYGLRELRIEDDNLLQKLHWLDHYYYLIVLRESCELLNRSQIMGQAYAEQVPHERLRGIPERADLWQVSLIRAYYRVFEMLVQPEAPTPFLQLKALLAAEGQHFLPDEARALYRHAQNYCIRRINQGQPAYLAEVLELYQTQLELGVIFIQGNLPHTDFKNINTAALRLKQFDWAHEFIHRYRERVPADNRENVYQFCLASFHYETGNHEQVLRVLREVSFTDDLYQISARLLLLRTLYETRDDESLGYSINALAQYLKRNRAVSRALRQQHLMFLTYLKQMSRLRERAEALASKEVAAQISGLSNTLKQARGVSNLSWLREQVGQLRP